VEKVTAPHEFDENRPEKVLELCLIMDCTSSMSSWISHCKTTLIEVLDESCEEDGSEVRVSFVGFRDFKDTNLYDIHEFTYDHDKMRDYISKRRAVGGSDIPEDVQGGLHQALNLDWTEDSIKVAFLCADAPCHGQKYHSETGDDYPEGSPDGLVLEKLVKAFSDREILLTCYKLEDKTEQMFEIMETAYNEGAMDDGFEFIDIRGQMKTNNTYDDSDDGVHFEDDEADYAVRETSSEVYASMTKANLSCQKRKMYSSKGW